MRKRVFALLGFNILAWTVFSIIDYNSEVNGREFEFGFVVLIPLIFALVYIFGKLCFDRKSAFRDSLFELGMFVVQIGILDWIVLGTLFSNTWIVEQKYTDIKFLLNGLEYPSFAVAYFVVIFATILVFALVRALVRFIISKATGKQPEVVSYLHGIGGKNADAKNKKSGKHGAKRGNTKKRKHKK